LLLRLDPEQKAFVIGYLRMVICYLANREALAWAVLISPSMRRALLEPRSGFLTRSFCQVFRGLPAACRLEMNRPFPESRRTVFSGVLVILFSFRFESAKTFVIGDWRMVISYLLIH